ncbi:MAG: hypothetical protein JKX88_07255 [Marinicaulis sp.]|nr:hypothetical protein [Marinicaulis sp.]
MMKFIASDIEAAKAKARRALGPKMVILSVRDLQSGDVEVTASDQASPSAPEAAPKAQFAGAARDAIDEGPFKTSAGARLNEAVEQRFSEEALAQLSGRLTGGKNTRRLDMSNVAVRSMAEALEPHGIGEALIAALVEGARKSPINEDLYRLEMAFRETFTFAPLQFSPTTPILLVGPTGAGKTSSAAKLAGAVINQGASAMLMSADAGRAGAVEQIKSYGQALGADVFIVESPLDVAQTIHNHRPGGAVIIDTPGVSPYDSGDIAAIKSFQQESNAEPVLVLSAGGDAAEYADWGSAFKEIGVRRCIITKFDATRRVGAALNAIHGCGLGLAHFSETAFISEGLIPANPEFLARRIIASRPGRMG